MKTPQVYKSLLGLAVVAVTVSFLSVSRAAQADQSPAAPVNTAKPSMEIFQNAEALFKKGDYDKVTDLLWKNIEKLDRKGLVLLAVAHEKKKDATGMMKAANMLTAKDPKDYEGFYLLGTAQLMNRKDSDALESLKSALEINPKYLPAYEKLEEMYEKKNNTYELRILFQDMVDKIGSKSEFLTKLCAINIKDFQEEEAIKACKAAIQKDPALADNYVNLGLAQQYGGNVDEARKSLKAAADLHPKSEFAQYTFAALLDEQKNFIESSKYYLAGTVADEKSARSWLGLAKSSFEVQKFEQSLEGFKRACKLDQKTATAFRKAMASIKRNKATADWVKPFEKGSEGCSGY